MPAYNGFNLMDDITTLKNANRDLQARLEQQETALQQLVADYQRLHDESAHKLQALATLTRISSLLNAQKNLDALLDIIVDASTDLMASEAGSLFLIDEEKQELYFHCTHGDKGERLRSLRIPMGVGIAGHVAQTGEPLLIADAQKDPRFYREIDKKTELLTRSILCVPLKADNKMLGALEVLNKKNGAIFTALDLELFTALAGIAAIAIYNMKLHLDLEDRFQDGIRALVNLIEASDSYTRGHSERVTYYSRMIAEELTLNEDMVFSIETAGMLHDIGKIGIASDIIRKPTRLTDEEYQAIQSHPTIGYNSIKEMRQLGEVLQGILHHHERYDGKGYPGGIKGLEIPLMARIIAVADTYDAMTSTRPYRPALAPNIAIAEIEKNAGTQFDPVVAEAFIEALKRQLAGEENI